MNKLTEKQIERLNELEFMLKDFLNNIDYLKKFGEDETTDINSLFDDLYDSVKERM